MNLENQFLQIKSFLERHIELINSEVLINYENLNENYHKWARTLAQLDLDKILALENKFEAPKEASDDLINYLQEINELTKLEKIALDHISIPKSLKRRMSLKKEHECTRIKAFLKDDLDKAHILDIGSGAAHLSSLLTYDSHAKSICVDQESSFQQIGLKKLKRECPELLERIAFKCQKFDKNAPIDSSINLMIGLHTCGHLANDLLDSYIKHDKGRFLNFGCCYHKLTQSHLNISKLAKKVPLKLTNHALTMAAKSYKTMTKSTYEKRKAVKDFRYTLHLFLKKYENQNFSSLGNAQKADYQNDFSVYAKKYYPGCKKYSDSVLRDFFKTHKSEYEHIQNLGIIRSLSARMVETYIILDRALYLKEQGHQVSVIELFNKDISPRNLGIYATN